MVCIVAVPLFAIPVGTIFESFSGVLEEANSATKQSGSDDHEGEDSSTKGGLRGSISIGTGEFNVNVGYGDTVLHFGGEHKSKDAGD